MKTLLMVLLISSFASATCPTQSAIGNSMIGVNAGALSPNRKRVSQFEITETGYLTAMHVYLQPAGDNQRIRGIIYSDLNGVPEQLLGVTQEYQIMANAPKGWVIMKMVTPVKVDAGQLWLGLHSDFTAAPSMMRYTPGKSRIISTDDYADGPSQTFGRPDTTLDGTMSVYAVYQVVPPSTCLSGSCALAKWAAPVDPILPALGGYRLLYGTQSGVYTASVEVDATTLQVQVSDLLPNVTYCFAVKAFTVDGQESQLSNEICITTLPGQNSLQF